VDLTPIRKVVEKIIFKDWASECTSFPNIVSEMALAHKVSDKVEAAYRRGDLLEKRRRLMEAWAAFATSDPAKAGNKACADAGVRC
jgi:hypothetical protein